DYRSRDCWSNLIARRGGDDESPVRGEIKPPDIRGPAHALSCWVRGNRSVFPHGNRTRTDQAKLLTTGAITER
ncbi:hypothetical protein, partial [Nitrolancea hollandica]|uniref:hypothetical protein n=1 Tax=Nitrolancea hollandica TaxID=1206749 RepID=UPI00058B8F0E